MSDGRGLDVADLPVIALAAGAWAGAWISDPGMAVAFGSLALALTGLLRLAGARRAPGRVASHRSGKVAAWCLALAALTSLLGARALQGLRPPERGDLDATVTLLTDPEPTSDGGLRLEVRLGGRRLAARADAPAAVQALSPRLAGERAVVRGTVAPFTRRRAWATARHLAGELTIEAVTALGDGAPHAAAANEVRRLLDRGASSLPADQRSLLAGLTLGDDRAQPAELAADFRASGLTHLLAVSGQNVAFLLVVASPLLRRLRLWPRFVGAVAVVAGFAFVTRFEPSVVRAAVVAGVALWATTTGRPSGGMRHLALAVAGLLVVDPLLTRSLGFRLSVAACVGVLVLSPVIGDHLRGPRWLREGLGVTAGAQLAVAPVLVPAFGPMPLAALPANVLAGPIAGALMVWGVGAGLVAGVTGGWVAWVLQRPTAIGLHALETVAAAGASLPLGQIDLRHLAVVAVAVLLWQVRHPATRTVAVVLAVGVLVVPMFVPVPRGSIPAGWAATVWTDGPVAVVDLDTGASAIEVLDVLRRRQVRAVGLVVVRSPRPELGAAVDAIRSRFPVGGVLAPDRSPVTASRTPPVGFRARVAGFVVDVAGTDPVLDVRIGWERVAP